MSQVVEVHDRMVSKLYERYNQLALEKSEAELKLRQALQLLSELQDLWMDLPPKVSGSISKMLASHGRNGASGVKDAHPSANGRTAWRWLSFSIEDVFGCTAARSTEPVEGPAKRPPAELEAALESPSRRGAGNAEDAGGPPGRSEALNVQPSGNEPVQVFLEPNAIPAVSSNAVEVGDLLYEAPGVSGLIAEIDVLCRALRKDAERAYEDMHQRIEDLKSQSKRHQERLQEHFNKSVEALQTELDLCKARIAQLTERAAPRYSLERDPQSDLCDGDWAWCQRAAELRAQVGSAHVGWLEDTLTQRYQVAQAQLELKEQNFQRDLSSLWERKVALTSRIRGRMTVGVGDGAAGGRATGTEEMDHLKKTLSDFEASALVPLRELAAAHGREEVEHVRRLKLIISETRTQCKDTSSHMGSLAQKCKAELRSRVSRANAAQFAHCHLRRWHLLATAFNSWAQERLAAGRARAEEEAAAQHSKVGHLDSQLRSIAKVHAKANAGLQRVKSKHSAMVLFLCRQHSHAKLVAIFRSWAAEVCRSQVVAARQHSTGLGDSTQVGMPGSPAAAGAAADGAAAARQIRSADLSSVAAALAAVRNRTKQRFLLAWVFGLWTSWRQASLLHSAEGRLQAQREQLEEQQAQLQELDVRLQSTEAAVGFKARRPPRQLLVAIWHAWSEQRPRRHVQGSTSEVSTQESEASARLAELRSQMMQLIDDAGLQRSRTE